MKTRIILTPQEITTIICNHLRSKNLYPVNVLTYYCDEDGLTRAEVDVEIKNN